MGYLRVRFLSKKFRFFNLNQVIISLLFCFLLMMGHKFLTMFCSSATLSDKNHVAPRLSFTNVTALNYLLRSEIFISEDRQLRAVHLILDFEPISKVYQEIGNAIKASDLQLAHIDVSLPSFLARDDLPTIVWPLQRNQPLIVQPVHRVQPEAAATKEEIASSNSSLEEEIDKFHYEEKEAREVQVIPISNAEGEPDRHSSVQAPTLVVARPNSSLEEEEDEMALNRGNKGLRELMASRSKVSSSKEATKSQVPTTLPPPPILIDLELKPIPNLKKKRPIEVLEEGEVGP